jgi:hypothetical protein
MQPLEILFVLIGLAFLIAQNVRAGIERNHLLGLLRGRTGDARALKWPGMSGSIGATESS